MHKIVPQFRVKKGMSEGKWFNDLSGETPLPEAARQVLKTRLDVVGKHLVSIAKTGDEDSEDVHQLRVSTRRVTAGLDVFVDCLPSKIQTQAKKELKRLRRAAGAARDWDVFLRSLGTRTMPPPARAAIDLVVGYGLGQHQAALAQLRSAAKEYAKDFHAFRNQLIELIQRHQNHVKRQTLASLPVTALFPLVRALDEAAGRDLSDADNLHKVRIAGKRLRYAMEVLTGCFMPTFRDKLYSAVETMQEMLGRANDSRFAIARLEELQSQLSQNHPAGWKSMHKALDRFIALQHDRLNRDRRRFERWYGTWKKSGGEPAFAALLLNGRADSSG
jgi:CHAD domain-containing protein